MAGQTLGDLPLAEASRTNATSIKGIPLVLTLAEPSVVPAGLPSTERATNAGTGRAPVGSFAHVNVEVGIRDFR